MKYWVRICAADLKVQPRCPAAKAVLVEADNPVQAAQKAHEYDFALWTPAEHEFHVDEKRLAAIVWPDGKPSEKVNVYFVKRPDDGLD